jgi:hypothetical protein
VETAKEVERKCGVDVQERERWSGNCERRLKGNVKWVE